MLGSGQTDIYREEHMNRRVKVGASLAVCVAGLMGCILLADAKPIVRAGSLVLMFAGFVAAFRIETKDYRPAPKQRR